MENLFNSIKLTRDAYCEKTLIHGIIRINNKGIPDQIIQREVKGKARQDTVRGTVKVEVRTGDPICPNILACSIYDTKPVHVISTVAKEVAWWNIRRKVYLEDKNTFKESFFKRLNVISLSSKTLGTVQSPNLKKRNIHNSATKQYFLIIPTDYEVSW